MRTSVSLFLLFAATRALAFNATEWHEKRELLMREAERLMGAYSNCVARLQTPAEEVTVPVDTFDDGSVRTVAFARRAQYFVEEGLIWAEDVVIRKYRPDGTLDGRIDAKSCVVDKESKSGWAEGPASVTHGSTTFRGRGVYFSSPEGYVRVFEDSEVHSRNLKFGEIRP